MGDSFDRVQRINEFFHQMALDQIDLTPEALPTGHCLNCFEPLVHERRWCDADCRDD